MDIDKLFLDIATFFSIDVELINEATVASDIEGWDSLSHVMLLLELESTYDLEFSPSEIANLKNVGDFYKFIMAKR